LQRENSAPNPTEFLDKGDTNQGVVNHICNREGS
jgi:hypothetical protein